MKISKEVKIPIILTGGIWEKEDIQKVYQNSNVEFFGLCRPFIKVPNYLEKLK